MLQWAPKIDCYLDIMYSHAAPITNPLCTKCGKGEAIWRCASCRASPLFCANCCRTEHEQRPFHRIEMWTGSSFEPSWLWKVGTCLYSGHGGAPCPKLPPMSFPTHTAEEYQEHAKSSRDNLNDITFGASPAISGKAEHAREVVVVHTNGVHQLLLYPCQCEGRKSEDLQVMEIGLYPSTFTSLSTVFTFDVLDDFLLSTMECNTTAQQYYGKLRRRTNRDFPESVKVRIRFLSLRKGADVCEGSLPGAASCG
jgi:CxC2 like cysteine cluster associated with KDZ transposases